MQAGCPTLEIFPLTIDLFADNGRVYLDVDDGTAISLNKEIVNQEGLFSDAVEKEFTLSLPNSDKNNYYLKTYYDPNTEKQTKYVICRLSIGSTTLYHSRLYASSKDNNTIEVVIKYNPDWQEQLKETKLKDLDLPVIEFTKEDVEARWAEDGIYNDGDVGYWYPMVFYGKWRVPNRRFVVEDLRPFIHALFILQKMFEKIGWCFESPFYKTSFGRRLICYLLKPDYGDTEIQRNKRYLYANKRYLAGTPLSQLFAFKILNWSEQQDNDNNFDPIIGEYNKAFEGKFKFQISTGDEGGNTTQECILRVFKNAILSPITPDDVIFSQQITLERHKEYDFEIPVNILADEYVWFSFHSVNDFPPSAPLPFTVEFHLWSSADRSLFIKGDTIDLSKEVNQEITCHELYLAFKHLIFGITDEDYTTKTVTLYTPYDADIFGEPITGYFNNDLTDLKDKQPLSTTRSEVEPIESRFINLGFKLSTDPLFKKQKRTNGTELYSKQIDLGESTTSETKDDLNPVFEGTGLKLETLLGRYLNQRAGFTRWFPFMTDNDKKEISYDIKPRIIYAAGYGAQGASQVLFNFETAYQLQMPIAFQKPEAIKINNQTPDERLVYGDEENDLWMLVYAKFYLQYKGQIKLDALVQLSHKDFFALSLRNKYEIEFEGHPVAGRILKITDFKPCDILTTQIIILPDLTTDNYCITPTVENYCNNYASITVTGDCECVNFSILGDYESIPDGITWEYKNADTGNEWEEIPSAGDTAQLCGLIIPTYVRAIISFSDDCSDIIATKFVNPCNHTLQCIISEYINELGEICLQWSYTGEILCGFDDLEVTINGDPLEDPYLFCGAENNTLYEFQATFTPSNGCDPITIECQITTGNPQCNNFPVLQCVPVMIGSDNCFEFIITGQLTSEIESFIVTGDCNGQEFTWMPGFDPICCNGTITASAMVFFCNCPMVCTSEITCVGSGCTAYDPGTPLMIAACN